MNELITGIGLGLGLLYVIGQFNFSAWIEYRRFVDLGLLILLGYLLIEISSNFMAQATTWAAITTSVGLRLMAWRAARKKEKRHDNKRTETTERT